MKMMSRAVGVLSLLVVAMGAKDGCENAEPPTFLCAECDKLDCPSALGGSFGGYDSCSQCTDRSFGALNRECTAERDACELNPICAGILGSVYNTLHGHSIVLACNELELNGTGGALALFQAVETCMTCGVCKSRCDSEYGAQYCEAITSTIPHCPQ